jgi:hypothetical protein
MALESFITPQNCCGEVLVTDERLNENKLTSTAQFILEQVPRRAVDRGMLVMDESAILFLTLWTLLLWERKVGVIALEKGGIDRLELARYIDDSLTMMASQDLEVPDSEGGDGSPNSVGSPHLDWGVGALLEPLVRRARVEASLLGHDYVGSEHLLLAVLYLATPSLIAFLNQHSVFYERTKELVLSFLAGEE